MKGGASEIIGPILSAIGKPAATAKDIINSYINLIGTHKENARLKTNLETLQLENQRIPQLEAENKRLKAILNLMAHNKNTYIAARVVGVHHCR